MAATAQPPTRPPWPELASPKTSPGSQQCTSSIGQSTRHPLGIRRTLAKVTHQNGIAWREQWCL